MANLILYIGLPMTATITLQIYLFPKLDEMDVVHYLCKKKTCKIDEDNKELNEVMESVFLDEEMAFQKTY
ncbi:MAG: hypothetical protein JKX98_06620 [Alcanivoracaceae bacterium]|nr:hypothetical protein [Alcanivoracaceae bacterium]